MVGDAAALSFLWADLAVKPDAEDVGLPAEMVAAHAVERVREDDASRIVVAELHSVVVGCAYLRVVHHSPLHGERVVHLSHLQVDPASARLGVDRALIEAAVGWAEHQGIVSLAASTAANDRDSNRFLARLGLTQVAVVRGASVSSMRSKLPVDPSAAMRGSVRRARNVDHVVAVRRSQRRSGAGDVVL